MYVCMYVHFLFFIFFYVLLVFQFKLSSFRAQTCTVTDAQVKNYLFYHFFLKHYALHLN